MNVMVSDGVMEIRNVWLVLTEEKVERKYTIR
jgi:hypothetical protein